MMALSSHALHTLIPLQPQGPPSSCSLSFLLLPPQGLYTCSLCLECSSPRYTHGLFPQALRSLHKYHLFNGAFSGHPTYTRLKNMASILVHHNIGTPQLCGTSPKVHLISDMAGSKGSNDIFEALLLSLHFLDTLSTTRLISPENRDSLFSQQFQTTPGIVSSDHS